MQTRKTSRGSGSCSPGESALGRARSESRKPSRGVRESLSGEPVKTREGGVGSSLSGRLLFPKAPEVG
jgi:hypothetical protein